MKTELTMFAASLMKHKDDLEKEIEIAEKYRSQFTIVRPPNKIELAKHEVKILTVIIDDFTQILIKLTKGEK